jgi:hypothetical protein
MIYSDNQVFAMTIREQILSKVEKLPESSLPAVYDFVERVEQADPESGLLRRLQKIKIEGPRDFARNIDLYMNGEKKIEDNLP